MTLLFNPLPDVNILDWPSADDILKCIQNEK